MTAIMIDSAPARPAANAMISRSWTTEWGEGLAGVDVVTGTPSGRATASGVVAADVSVGVEAAFAGLSSGVAGPR
ncbi:hypothetical protein DW352_14915 [Pseudolabrys taiwanensis]|uniref:Uncharacterized protein n=2 Tax=Pseudolabrys taiwanensis TaxID=331696 RepID=A0A345ZXQ0_9HYPH|nr:hypothetical protein DW352_14915 [Pseudolabrys taiwanensis]